MCDSSCPLAGPDVAPRDAGRRDFLQRSLLAAVATFDYTGRWTGGQRTRNLQSYPTTYNAATGTLTIG